MIVPGLNLLIDAYNKRDPEHEPAKAWWETTRNTPVGLPWTTTSGFIRSMTHCRVLAEPIPPDDALDLVRS